MDGALIDQVVHWADRIGIVCGLIVVVVSVLKGHWVPGYEYKNRVAEIRELTAIARVTADSLEKLTESYELLSEQVGRLSGHVERMMVGWRPPRQ